MKRWCERYESIQLRVRLGRKNPGLRVRAIVLTPIGLRCSDMCRSFSPSTKRETKLSCSLRDSVISRMDRRTEAEFSVFRRRRREDGAMALMNSKLIRRTFQFLCFLVFLFAWTSFGQQSDEARSPAAGGASALFASDCGVCHGSDGRGGERAPNIATDREMVNLSDARLQDILSKGVLASGMPAFGFLGQDKVKALVQYLRVLQGVAGAGKSQLPGDPGAGEQVFFGAAACSNCHMVSGRGGFLGEDLSAYAKGRSPEGVRAAILHPESNRGDAGHMVQVTAAGHKTYQGLVRSRDNFNLVLQSEDGAFHSIARSEVQQLTTSKQPLMPQDYGSKLDDKQIDDLVSYLLKSAGVGKQTTANDGDEE